ncbi:hypothetical protein PIB30_068626 [Stylosanthes scabra]|uniref:DDE Tnp4 domain-containing protein n=1 Tax=Stylosanthes scabra TaxID=79078 RepID=A0ABU6SNC4_9FABA|nr:hypothetical protein [Stylosanthes scabra]
MLAIKDKGFAIADMFVPSNTISRKPVAFRNRLLKVVSFHVKPSLKERSSDCNLERDIERIVSKVECLEMSKAEKSAVRKDITYKSNATEIKANHVTRHIVTRDTHP